MKRFLLLLAFTLMLLGTVPVSARTGSGGYNSYRGKKYTEEDFDTLRERLAKDGYFRLTAEDNPLKDTSFCYNYIINGYNAEYYEVWIDDDDYGDYASAGISGDKASGLGLIEQNAVVIGWHEYVEVDEESPSGLMNNDIPADWERGTLQFVAEMGEGLHGDITVTLYESERNEYYAFMLFEANGWSEINVLPKGHYYISNIYFSDGFTPVYDRELGMGGNGFFIRASDSKIIYAGFGTEDIPNPSWKQGEEVKLTGVKKKEPTPTPIPGTEPAPVTVDTEKPPSGEEQGSRLVYAVFWAVIVAIAGIAVIIFIRFKKKGNSDEL